MIQNMEGFMIITSPCARYMIFIYKIHIKYNFKDDWKIFGHPSDVIILKSSELS